MVDNSLSPHILWKVLNPPIAINDSTSHSLWNDWANIELVVFPVCKISLLSRMRIFVLRMEIIAISTNITILQHNSAPGVRKSKSSRRVKMWLETRYQTSAAQNGYVDSSASRPRHHANSFAKCQGHQPAHFGTSNVEWAPNLASPSSPEGGNVPLW